jgi:single-strand DNA-binding protein
MSFEIQGKLHKKFEIESKSASFQTREFVLLIEEGNYPQYIKFQLTQDRCNIIDIINEGENLKVWFDLRGREWNEKYFTNLNAWKVEKQNTAGNSDQHSSADEIGFPEESDFENIAGSLEDDLPF